MQKHETLVKSAAPTPSQAVKHGNEAGNGKNGSFLRIINVWKRIHGAAVFFLSDPEPGRGIQVFRCRTCRGTGKILNPYFEVCKESFQTGEMACHRCTYRGDCERGREISCDQCKDGYLVVRLSEFEPCGMCA